MQPGREAGHSPLPSTEVKNTLSYTSMPPYVFMCFNWAPRYEGVLGEWRYSSTHFLTSALDGGELSASLPGRFNRWYPLDRRLGGLQSRSGRGGKSSQPPPGTEPWNPDRSARSPALYRLSCHGSNTCSWCGTNNSACTSSKCLCSEHPFSHDSPGVKCCLSCRKSTQCISVDVVLYCADAGVWLPLSHRQRSAACSGGVGRMLLAVPSNIPQIWWRVQNTQLPDEVSISLLGSVYRETFGLLERELQMVQLSATRCSCVTILWDSPVSFGAITLCVVSQRVFIFLVAYFVIDSVRKLLDTSSYGGDGFDSFMLRTRIELHALTPPPPNVMRVRKFENLLER
jgi:hypothetical protein